MNVFAILGVAAEFPDGVSAAIAELVVVSVSEFFSQCLCAILCDDCVCRFLPSEYVIGVERLNFFENVCIESIADA